MISQTPGQGEAAEPSATIKLVVSTGVVSTDRRHDGEVAGNGAGYRQAQH